MRGLKIWMKAKMRAVQAVLWCHRAMYGGLAATYGAGCVGLLDKGDVGLFAALLYTALTVQR